MKKMLIAVVAGILACGSGLAQTTNWGKAATYDSRTYKFLEPKLIASNNLATTGSAVSNAAFATVAGTASNLVGLSAADTNRWNSGSVAGTNAQQRVSVVETGKVDVGVATAGDITAAQLGAKRGYDVSGQVVAWGANSRGQCNVPESASNSVIAISDGSSHVLALRSDGRVVAWGWDGAGQIDVPALASNSVIQVCGGFNFSAALRSSGQVVVWGDNFYGQCNVPAVASNSVIAVACGNNHVLALRSDGGVVAWGYNGNGQCNVPAAASNSVIAISGGSLNSVALRSDGRVVAWGYNGSGQCNVPAVASNAVIAISAGYNHVLALRSDGGVIAWGDNDDGQCNVPAAASNSVIAVAGGAFHSLALRSDGRVVAWGLNGDSQCNVSGAASNSVMAIDGGFGFSAALIGATTLGNTVINGNLTPTASNQYSLGSQNMPFKDLFLDTNSVYMGGTKVLSYNPSSTSLVANVPMTYPGNAPFVSVTGTPTNNQVIAWNAAGSQWNPTNQSGSGIQTTQVYCAQAGYAGVAGSATNSQNSGYATNAGYAVIAGSSTNANYAIIAGTATNVPITYIDLSGSLDLAVQTDGKNIMVYGSYLMSGATLTLPQSTVYGRTVYVRNKTGQTITVAVQPNEYLDMVWHGTIGVNPGYAAIFVSAGTGAGAPYNGWFVVSFCNIPGGGL